jgi:hypothetical protein
MPTNVYGDDLDLAEGGHGAEIARQRMDALDREALAYALELGSGCAIDLGCGAGVQGLRFAALGFETVLIDTLPHERTVLGAAEIDRVLPIRYLRTDARGLREDDLPARVALAYSQRFIHHLAFGEAVALLRVVRARMPAGARLFLSASGLASELGEGYRDASRPLSARYAALTPAMRAKHHIEGPVCLYSRDDLASLARAAGFQVERVALSEFGNVKGVFEVGPAAP